MSTALKWLAVSLAAYFVAWSLSYVLMMMSRGDSLAQGEFFFQYLALAWSFSGGELPTFIWAGSVVIFLVLMGLLLVVRKMFNRGRESAV